MTIGNSLHHRPSPITLIYLCDFLLLHHTVRHRKAFQRAGFHLNTNHTNGAVCRSRQLAFSCRSHAKPVTRLQFYGFSVNHHGAASGEDGINFFILLVRMHKGTPAPAGKLLIDTSAPVRFNESCNSTRASPAGTFTF